MQNLERREKIGISADAMKDKIIAEHKHSTLSQSINVEKLSPTAVTGLNLMNQKQMYLRKQEHKTFKDILAQSIMINLNNVNTQGWLQNADLPALE